MGAKHFIAYIFIIKFIMCTDFDSYEVNRIEFTPLHDAIIFKDIADIMSEFESNMFTELNSPVINFSESDEDIEDLLSEYQHYLDKAHKQRVGYIEKGKSKNKIPPLRHDKYSKLKPKTQSDDQSNYYYNMKHHTPFFNAIELPIRGDYENNMREKTVIDLGPVMSKPNYEPIMSSCRCKANQIPCRCPCKQCLITLAESGDLSQDKLLNSSNDKLSLRIKVDVQLPSLSELINAIKSQNYEKRESLEWPTTKNFLASINVPFPYADFPIPVNTFDFRDNFLKGNSNVHKITIHKKKKSRSNSNKKHKGRKLFNFHHDNLEPKFHDNNTHIVQHDTDNKTHATNSTEAKTVLPSNTSDTIGTYNILNNSATDISKVKLNSSFYTINLTMNITNDNSTEETPKIENSIESDYDKENKNITGQPSRLKREINDISVLPIKAVIRNIANENQQFNQTYINKTREFKKSVTTDSILLYWPNDIKTQPSPSRNITAIIMEREAKKRKLNMTQEVIRSNRTKALEQAIFGDVNWNDVDTVAPVFMSFVGKYIKGVLTFCSETVCHSMKCSDKVCTHRICIPQNRFNQNGHCSGNNDTDSVANMESIMDLPSSVAFEIVDILQDNLSGKIYGKMTLCINSKCCTFVAAKKSFQKSKCTYKEIDASGHCQNLKNTKAK